MAIILNIETAVEGASICLSHESQILGSSSNPSKMDSASWLHVAIRDLLNEKNVQIKDLQAIGISSGPGSYTGLRVGMAAAKGLCYAARLPLITINTLEIMATAAKKSASTLLCPMIDARRMEVFTAVYNQDLQVVLSPVNMVLTEGSFSDLLNDQRLTFFGNGSQKFKQLIQSANADFIEVNFSAKDMLGLALQKFNNSDFADLAYAEPFYGKAFYSPPAKKKL